MNTVFSQHEVRTFNQMRRRREFVINRRRIVVSSLILIVVAVVMSVVLFSTTVTAQRTSRTKLITSLEIQEGDSLWSIASNYITDEYKNIEDYIVEIKQTNRLTSDLIHTGKFIIVPYYTDITP